MSLSVAALAWLLAAAPAVPAPLLDCGVVPGWTLDGEPRTYEPDNLFDYMNGNAEGYLLYRFLGMKGITCRSGEATIVMDVSEMTDPDLAYGIFAAHRDPRHPLTALGTAGQVLARRITFVKDKYYVEVASHASADVSEAALTFARRIESQIPGRTTPPDALAWFPKLAIVPDSVRLVPESVLGIRLLRQGWVAQYELGKAFVVTEASPEAAADVYGRLRTRVGTTSPVAAGEEGFSGTDRYLDGMYVFRKGRYVAGLANVKSGSDPLPVIRALAESLP